MSKGSEFRQFRRQQQPADRTKHELSAHAADGERALLPDGPRSPDRPLCLGAQPLRAVCRRRRRSHVLRVRPEGRFHRRFSTLAVFPDKFRSSGWSADGSGSRRHRVGGRARLGAQDRGALPYGKRDAEQRLLGFPPDRLVRLDHAVSAFSSDSDRTDTMLARLNSVVRAPRAARARARNRDARPRRKPQAPDRRTLAGMARLLDARRTR